MRMSRRKILSCCSRISRDAVPVLSSLGIQTMKITPSGKFKPKMIQIHLEMPSPVVHNNCSVAMRIRMHSRYKDTIHVPQYILTFNVSTYSLFFKWYHVPRQMQGSSPASPLDHQEYFGARSTGSADCLGEQGRYSGS